METKSIQNTYANGGTILDYTTCDEEALAYFDRPDSEKELTLEGWRSLYQARLRDGYYDRLKVKEEAIAHHPMMKAVPPFRHDLYMKVYETLSETYPWAE